MENNKKTQKQRDSLVAQSNDLVRAKYSTSLWERRLFIEMIQTIEQKDAEFKWITLYYSDLISTYEGNSNRDYERITKAAKSLGHKVMFLPFIHDGEEREISHSVVQVNVPKNLDDGYRKYIKLKFNDDLKPFLLKLEKNYFLYNKANIIGIKKKYTFDFYELFKQLEREDKNTTKVYFSIDEFREHFLVDAFGNPTKQYKKFSDIERYIIQPSRKEMREQTDLSFDYDKQKKGRKIVGINFTAYKNRKKKEKNEPQQLALEIPETTASQPKEKPTREPQKPIQKAQQQQPKTAKAPAFDDPIHNNQAYQQLVEIGIAQYKSLQLAKTYDSAFILETIKRANKVHQQIPKKNIQGFIVSCIEKGTYKTEIEQEQQKKTKNQQQAQQQRIKEENNRQIEAIKKDFETAKKAKIEKLKTIMNEEEKTAIIAYVREKYDFIVGNRIEEKLISSVFFGYGIEHYYQNTEKLARIDVDFIYYMEKKYKVKCKKNNNTGQYEIVQ